MRRSTYITWALSRSYLAATPMLAVTSTETMVLRDGDRDGDGVDDGGGGGRPARDGTGAWR